MLQWHITNFKVSNDCKIRQKKEELWNWATLRLKGKANHSFASNKYINASLYDTRLLNPNRSTTVSHLQYGSRHGYTKTSPNSIEIYIYIYDMIYTVLELSFESFPTYSAIPFLQICVTHIPQICHYLTVLLFLHSILVPVHHTRRQEWTFKHSKPIQPNKNNKVLIFSWESENHSYNSVKFSDTERIKISKCSITTLPWVYC
jgi:hypothetical protein